MCLRTCTRVYQMMSFRMKRQVLYTAAVWLLCFGTAVAFADDPSHPAKAGASWFTLPNIMAVISLVYGAGVVREQFAELRERVSKLEDEIPETYVRKDVFEARVGK